MIPIEVKRIIEVVERNRRKRVNEIRKASMLEVKKMMGKGKGESESLRKKILEDYERRVEMLRRKGLADIEMRRREELKGIKSDMVKTLKEGAVSRVRGNNYENFLKRFLEKGIKEMGRENLEVFVNKNDVDFVKDFLGKKGMKGKVKDVKTNGGCMVKSGKMTANYLIESLLERKKGETDKIVNEMFFKG